MHCTWVVGSLVSEKESPLERLETLITVCRCICCQHEARSPHCMHVILGVTAATTLWSAALIIIWQELMTSFHLFFFTLRSDFKKSSSEFCPGQGKVKIWYKHLLSWNQRSGPDIIKVHTAGDFCDLKHQSPKGCTASDAHRYSPVSFMLPCWSGYFLRRKKSCQRCSHL